MKRLPLRSRQRHRFPVVGSPPGHAFAINRGGDRAGLRRAVLPTHEFLGYHLGRHRAHLWTALRRMSACVQKGLSVVIVDHVERASIDPGLNVTAQGCLKRGRETELTLQFYLETAAHVLARRHGPLVRLRVFYALSANRQTQGHQRTQQCPTGLSPPRNAPCQQRCRLERLKIAKTKLLLQTQENGL